MNQQQVLGWINVVSVLVSMGVQIGGQLKSLFSLFGVSHTLTDEQINAIEQAGIADNTRRMNERIAMGAASQ